MDAALETRTARILVVDDDALISMSTVDMIEDLGYKALEAGSGKHALEVLETAGQVDLVMTDYSMPGMNGAELADRVHQLYPGLPVLLSTGYSDLPSGRKVDLPRISKPYMLEQLRIAIDQILSKRA
jgi:CheY-like chemotaxis protein